MRGEVKSAVEELGERRQQVYNDIRRERERVLELEAQREKHLARIAELESLASEYTALIETAQSN